MVFRNNKVCGRIAGLALLLSVLSGCIFESSDCPSDAADRFLLRMMLATSDAVGTRADGHNYADATAAENHIDLAGGDFSVVLYDMNGGFLQQLDDAAVYRTGEGLYYMETVLDKDLIASLSAFQVMVVANWKAYDASLSYGGLLTTTAADNGLWKDGSNFNFSLQTYLAGNGTAWTPDIDAKRLIPMFGISTVLKSDFESGPGGVSHAAIQIPLLRALAKIEVVDNTPSGYEISDVRFTKYNMQGRLIPDISTGSGNEAWAQEGTQVTAPSVPSGSLATGTDLKFVELKNSAGKSVWTAYVAEAQFAETTLTEDRPHLKVEVESDGDQTYTYPVHFAQYSATGSPTIPADRAGWHRLLRNHIYRYEVNSANVTTALTLNVLPWDLAEDEIWFYEDVAGNVDPLQWTNVLEENDRTAQVWLNISNAKDEILHGEFTLPSPRNGRWHAYLMTMGDAIPTAVTFCKEDGTNLDDMPEGGSVTHVWGDLIYQKDGEKDVPVVNHIYLKATNLGEEQESRFRLLIMVENANGNWMEVDLTPDDSNDDVRYWTIIRGSTVLGD